eukprot:Hpha_TRINITY_DN25325_c0_g1::TRINITY_DN25325_c0_g1_i1::g.2770::m.2770
MQAMLKASTDWMMREGDTEEVIKIKRLFTPLIYVVTGGTILDLFRALLFNEEYYSIVIAQVLGPFLLYLLGAKLGWNVSFLMDFSMIVAAVVVLGIDLLHAATLQSARWSLNVIVLDVSLVFDRKILPIVVIPLTLVYLFSLS